MGKNKNRRTVILSVSLVAITLPLVLGAGLISEKEKIILAVLSMLLFIFYIVRPGARPGPFRDLFLRGLDFVLFLSLFWAGFLTNQFIFFKQIDLFPFQAAILILFFVLVLVKRPPRDLFKDNLSLGFISMVVVTFLLNLLVNRAILGFYLNFWIDLKRHWPVFLFGLTYFIRSGILEKMAPASLATPASRRVIRRWTYYFMGLFIITLALSFFNLVERMGLATRKVKYNLAFFYNKESWLEKTSSFRRGLVYEYLGLWPKARVEFKKILISSEDIEAHFNLARSYLAEELWYEAMLEYRRVIELNPNFPGSHYGLAKSYEALGLMGEMEEEFLKEIKTNPEEIRAYLSLEEFYRKKGLVKELDKIKSQRLQEITTSIEEKDISDANLKIIPVVLNGGSLTVEVVARGTSAQGFWPRMEVWLSKAGSLERGGDTFVKSETWKSYYFHFKTCPGQEKLIVHFTNDFYGGPANDRNLYLKRINFIYSR